MDELHRRVVRHIRAAAKRERIPVTHLPDRSGVSRSHFWDVMAGRSSPTLSWLKKIADALDADAADLVARDRPSR